MFEMIQWRPADQSPDDDTTVMIQVPPEDTLTGTSEVWFGYRDGDTWREVDGMPVQATWWADLPAGPPACRAGVAA
jgi:hypothetical protein